MSLAIAFNLLLLVILAMMDATQTIDTADWAACFLFGVLIVFTMTFGMPLAGGMISLLPMVVVATYLQLGLTAASWLIFAAVWIHGILRYFLTDRLKLPFPRENLSNLINRAAVNSIMTVSSIMVGGFIFEQLGTRYVLSDMGYPIFLIGLGAGYFFINYIIAGIHFLLESRDAFRRFFKAIPSLLLYEAVPVIFAPLVVLTYAKLGWQYFALLSLALAIITFIVRNLNETRLNLDRRIRELDSLQIVGQTLSASLDFDSIMTAVHAQVARLMPASTFYIALYDQENGEVSFPLAIENDAPVQWQARRAGNGFTEYVLRTGEPLLVRRDVAETAVSLGLDKIGLNAASWLGVPLMLGEDPIGVIAVQSFSQTDVYDASHRAVLTTLATQAAMAIQNARLYANAGSALAQRVQELDSILRTTHDGILLFNAEWRVLTANRAFGEFANLGDMELTGRLLVEPLKSGESNDLSLLDRIGYTQTILAQDCDMLARNAGQAKAQIVMAAPVERHVERTLAPVHDQRQTAVAWLLVLRDNTEETEFAKMRDDMTHMVVHDLRSPLSVTLGSLETIGVWLEMGRLEDVNRLLELARLSGDRMLQLLNDLLDAYKFESGQVPLDLEPMPILPWLNEAHAQFNLAAIDSGLTIEVDVAPNLPLLAADKAHMARVLSNLVDNAVKFTPDGGHIRLWAKAAPGPDANTMTLVGVSDTGTGIPVEEQERLFLKFHQNAAIKGRRKGSGLGLTYCKLVVEAHGGRIWVESPGLEGEGSTFVMALLTHKG